jgi:hypothetical protein
MKRRLRRQKRAAFLQIQDEPSSSTARPRETEAGHREVGPQKGSPKGLPVPQALPVGGSPHALFECVRGHPSPMTLSLGLGVPLSVSESGKLLPGTYTWKHSGKTRREKLQDPDFIRAFVSTVVLVSPERGWKHSELSLTKFAGRWQLLRDCYTLKAARAIAGLALTSPQRVVSTLGRSLHDLATRTPDQLRWLWKHWRTTVRRTAVPDRTPRHESLIRDWVANREARSNLASLQGISWSDLRSVPEEVKATNMKVISETSVLRGSPYSKEY